MFKFLKEKLKQWTEKIAKSPKSIKEEKPAKKEKASKRGKAGKTKKEVSKKTKTKEISMPAKFNSGTESYESDLEKLKEIVEEEDTGKELPKSFFQRVKEKAGKVKISEEDFEKYNEELEILLLENNVAFEVVDKIIKILKEQIVGKELLKKEVDGQIRGIFGDIISQILIKPFDLPDKIRLSEKKPFVILFFGINGSGKTTTIAKLARFLEDKRISCVMAAADTFRAASIEQLKEHGKRIKTDVIAHEYGSDPAAVGFDAINYAKKKGIDCVLIDTAGRMHTEKNLIREMEKISRVCHPDLKIFIAESITGNDATEQARAFHKDIGIDGIILAKSDIDEKGGTALSIGYVTGKPILFLGTGQAYSNLEPFDRNKFLEKLGL
ncbi:MAG: signal recognition particle-docking protein FtsY [Candidatus Nanoarchaeia archaeon]|nr:signal recognition particle-docking protein FtsY [Candidatus Nanoarchaeia archaeon]